MSARQERTGVREGGRDTGPRRWRRSLPGLVAGLGLALLLPVAVAWMLWTPAEDGAAPEGGGASTLIEAPDVGNDLRVGTPAALAVV